MPIKDAKEITALVLKIAAKARDEQDEAAGPAFTGPVQWPVECTVGPGLEGAIACESKVGYVDGTQGTLIYRGYDIYDLCAYSTFEEVSYLLVHGRLPTPRQLTVFKKKLAGYRRVTETLRILMQFPVEQMNAMAALRLGTNLMRQEFTAVDRLTAKQDPGSAIRTDEDSIAMETMPRGEEHAVYEFRQPRKRRATAKTAEQAREEVTGQDASCHLIAGVGTIAAAIQRFRQGQMPVDPDPDLSHAGNYLYMITGRKPTGVEERLMDISLILHADHGMNASTFASMVVASTLSDMYLSIGSGIAALNGPLHGGANEQVMKTLREIGGPDRVKAWFEKTRSQKRKVMGFGHRVYKAYDPRARILGPLAKRLCAKREDMQPMLKTAEALEKAVIASLGQEKGIYPNVDFYSGLVYAGLGIPEELFTPTFAVSRVSGWTARVLEYLANNRIFRPRAIYTGPFRAEYVPLEKRGTRGKKI